ncbi:MAG: GAF domain-containing protein [Myxococcales bacterium]|nr:GAF domain-containing protein [Myxococcales bacterium]
MGELCAAVFREAEQIGGIPAKARLAAIARMTSAEANATRDDPQTVDRLRQALDRLRAELSRKNTGAFEPVVPREPPAPRPTDQAMVPRLRRHIEAIVDLMSQRALLLTSTQETAKRIDEVAASVLGVARVSVWLRDPKATKITCIDLFEAGPNKHSAGAELKAVDFGPYFDALDSESTIMAHDAVNDPRTRCFAKTYLAPLGIGAMLDVPIWARSKMVGVICHEHVGGARTWTQDEERFAYMMSGFLALAIEREG